jgi:hypothetical protein
VSKLQMGGVMLVTLFGLMVSSGTRGISAEDPKQGVTVQGSQLKAMPGYVLEKRANNEMTARRRAGGGIEITFTCGCANGTGECSGRTSDVGDIAVCSKSANAPCSGQCAWTQRVKVPPPTPR